ncbi:MAG: hypothetical protein EZS28_018178 [Streblomastix strix]|uniref:Uncharacterized protein n=1 Tax=Streblomastix strix TaxID=222440 RepID=A0A5J4VUJ9_9EUKA|nr:MAG: hypothetical protein EZS28_018178 [Streblomastix strix]
MVFSTAGGFAEENNFDILISLIKIDNFIFNLYNGRKISKRTPRPSFPSQPILAKTCIEQIEEQGGFEEIEAHLTNQGKDGNDYIKFNAIEVKGDLSKFFIDESNPKPRWY